jgi:hypothetical protein
MGGRRIMAKLTGTNPDQVPTNADLGTMAYQDKDNVKIDGGEIAVSKYQDASLTADRTSNDGSIISVSKDGSEVGSVGTYFGHMYVQGSGDRTGLEFSTSGSIIPRRNNARADGSADLGSSSYEFRHLRLGGTVYSSSGRLELDGNDIGGTQVTIADDAVASITPPRKGGFMFITAQGNTDYPQATIGSVLYYDVGASLQLNRTTFGGVGNTMDVVTTDLTGTTGTDGRVTVTVQTGVVKIENRYGSSTTFQITFL